MIKCCTKLCKWIEFNNNNLISNVLPQLQVHHRCWIQLVIVYCLWYYTNVISVISHLPSSDIQQMHSTVSTELTRSSKKRQFLPSSLGHRRKDSSYRAHSVIEEKIVSTELTRSSKKRQFLLSSLGHRRKDGEVSFHRAHSVIEENMEKSVSPSSLGHHRKLSAYRVHPAIEGFHGILYINRAQSVNTGIIFWTEFTMLGRPVKGFVNLQFNIFSRLL